MKATIDIPDQLYRQVKARSALAGRSIRDVTIELYEGWLAGSPTAGDLIVGEDTDAVDAAARWLAGWERLGEEIAQTSVDPRTTREILIAERR